ncbi:MAG TPA: MFS transporter [Acidimicrobiia bacterium]|jgi:MFS family permease|nr:MFS transporter [Acidimicrobiia bacterium]
MSELRDLLRIRDYRLLWTAQVLSDFGDNLTFFTLLFLIQRLTGSTVALAGLMVAVALPTLIFGTLAGVYVDRVDRRKAMMAADLLRGLVVLCFLFVRSEEMVPLLYLIAFVQASIGTVFNPARGAFLPAVVGTERLLAANSVSQTSRIVFNLLGTATAGILAAASATLAPAFIIDSVTFFLSFVLIGRIRTSGVPEEVSETRVSSELKEGFVVMMRSRPLRAVMVSLSVTMLGLGAVNVLFVPFLIDDLAVSEAFLGAIEASQVAGLVISGTLVAVLASRLRPSGLVSAGLVGLGAFIAAISGAGAVWQVMVLLFLVGICVGPVQAGANTLSQTLIEDKLRGRVGGALNTLISAANVTSMGLAGIAAAALGTRNVFLLSGCVVIGSGALAYWLFGELRGRVPEPARSEAA